MSSAASQAYCLRRNNHRSDLIDDFDQMLKDESLVDVTLFCDEGTIRAHKMVLSACSSYFRSIFSKLTHPLQYPVIVIKDMPFCDLKAIVEFIYRGEVTVPQEQLPSVLKSAESLKVKGLSEVNTLKSSKCGDGQENESPMKKRRKKRRKISRCDLTSNTQQGSCEDDISTIRRDSSEENSEYSDDEEDVSNCNTNVTAVNRRSDVRTFSTKSNAVEADIEPVRLLEQSMITGEDAQENGNIVPRFSAPVNISNVQSMSAVSSQDVKPLLFDENAGLMPQLSTSLSTTLPSNESAPIQTTISQNHLPSVSVPCSLGFDTSTLSTIPGPSSIPQVSRPPQSAQEQFVVGSPHQVSHPHSAHLLTPQMHPSIGCHTFTSMSVETLSGRRHFQCPVCLKSFSEKGNMKRHTQIHLQQRNRYMCDLCSKCFAWKDNFNRHRRLAHCERDVK